MSGYVPLNERRHRAHAKLLDAVGTGGRVLDVGSSSGYLAQPLAERGNTIVGLELDPDAARAAEAFCERCSSATSRRWSCRSSRARSTSCSLGDVIEHLRDPVAALARLRPLLRPGRPPRPLDAERRQLGDPALASSAAAGGTRTAASSTARTRISSPGRRWRETIERAGYEVVRIDYTVPVPGDSDLLDGLGRAVGRLRPVAFRLPVRGGRPNEFVTAAH